MIIKLNNPKAFVDAIGIISELITEVKAKVSKDGLSITAFDPANVALVSLDIPASAFSQLEVDKEEVLGLNLDDLKQILRRASAGSSLIIKKEEENLLHIEIKNKVQRNFSLALIANEEEEKRRQKLDFSSKIEMNSGDFVEAIEDASIVSDACSFVTKKGSFVIESKGALKRAKAEFTENDAVINSDNAKAKYSLEYLMKFIKGSRISDKVALNFSSDYPLQVDFKGDISLSFVLAPRVEEEE